MAVPLEQEQGGIDFLENSNLSYFVPLATSLSIQQAVKDAPGQSPDALLDSIEHRESLFFDESVDVYLVLRTPPAHREALRSSLRRLVVTLEASVTNTNAPTSRDSHSPYELIYSSTVDETEEPVIIFGEGDNSKEDNNALCTHAVWKLPVFLGRPRIRLQSPSVIFVATASLKPADLSLSDGLRDGYLPSGMPSGLNLLDSFSSDPALDGIKPRLSALRVSRVAPVTQQAKDLLRPIKSLPQLSLRVFPAVHSRVRFSRPHVLPAKAAMIAMLEVDFTPFFECEISIDEIALSLSADGVVESLTDQPGMTLPMSCVAHDHVTFLYRISPAEEDVMSKYPNRDLDITISATALVEPGICQPRLQMAWTAAVDFTLPLNPGYGFATQPIQRSHRPSQLSIGGNSTISLTAPSVSQPDALPSLEQAAQAASANQRQTHLPEMGLNITFMAPSSSQEIYPGDEFVWNAFVVNRVSRSGSDAQNRQLAPRKLALIPIPRRRRNESRVNRPPSMSRPADTLRPRTPRDRTVADAVMDENVVHAMQRSSLVDSADVASLSADVRVGPLAAGACHVAELRFLALKEGIIGVEAVRVVDLNNNEHVDIWDLPTVVVERRPEDKEEPEDESDEEDDED